jgi:hypothetical protein
LEDSVPLLAIKVKQAAKPKNVLLVYRDMNLILRSIDKEKNLPFSEIYQVNSGISITIE